ncbi:hypothetical protein BC943DRAFT_340284 [Umbelopsis sp. AD052]|nr:hypothetical protein BC943DRAFT_340284 [Umbelopsis sp. AD052]
MAVLGNVIAPNYHFSEQSNLTACSASHVGFEDYGLVVKGNTSPTPKAFVRGNAYLSGSGSVTVEDVPYLVDGLLDVGTHPPNLAANISLLSDARGLLGKIFNYEGLSSSGIQWPKDATLVINAKYASGAAATLIRDTNSPLTGLIMAPLIHVSDGNIGHFAGSLVASSYM